MLLASVLVDESTVPRIEVPLSAVFRLVGSGEPSKLRLAGHTYGITFDHEVEAFGQ